MMVGGFSAMRPVSDTEREIFNRAMNGLVGVNYEPLLVADQVMNGKNYCFICNATTVTPNPQVFAVKVTVYAPLPGKGDNPVVVDITRI